MRPARLLVLPLLVPALLGVAPPASAGEAPATCAPGPVELVTGGPTSAAQAPTVAGQDAVFGALLRRREGGGRDCVVPGATVQLLAREKNSSVVRVVRTGTTDAEGRVQFRVTPPRTVVLSARYAEASSPSVVVGVRVRVAVASRALAGCRLEVTGRTTPAKPGSRVRLQDGGTRLADAVVAADGTFRAVQAGACASAGRLVASLGETHTNEPGTSAPAAPPATSLRTCGTGGQDAGPPAPGLVHRLVVFGTETVVGGAWYGERVVGNPTDRPVTYTAGSSFSVGQPYRLFRPGSTQVVGREGFTDAGRGLTPRTLQPGEEERVPVVLDAANCYRDEGPVFASTPGPDLPPGRYVGASELQTAVDGRYGTWSSQRVALTVL